MRRLVALAALVAVVLIVVGGLIFNLGGLRDGLSRAFGNDVSHAASSTTRADQVRQCEQSHHLSRANQTSNPPPQNTEINFVTKFESCAWPPPAGADPDGYTLIEVDSRQGPGTNEATGTDVADVIFGTCSTFRLMIQYAAQGAQSSPSPLTLNSGQKLTADGHAYRGDIGFYPDPSRAVLLHNAKNEVTSATCG